MKPIRWLAIPIIISIALLAGCETTRPGAPSAPTVNADTAEKAERNGEHLLAASEYLRLAQISSSPQKQHFQLQATAALLNAGQVREARAQVDQIDVTGLDGAFVARKRILQARISILEGGQEKAIRQLDEASEQRNLNPATLAEINSVRAQVELALDNPIGAVRNLISREQYIAGKDAVSENQQRLWKILVSLPRARLATEFNNARDPILSGWIELALIAVENAGQSMRLGAALEQWKKTHPTHPATTTILSTLISPMPGISARIERVALLLPLTSGYSVAAQAVRDGFMAMDAASAETDKPKISVYDIGGDPAKAPEFYDQAVNDGAQFVVGPLGRDAALAILKKGNIKVPTLMLNQTDEDPDTVSKYLFQFGLAPEQEAQQVAERAYLDGHRQAAVLYPQTPWGERMMTAWTTHWQRLGGVVVASQFYNEADSDYSDPIKRLLNITQSEARKELIEKRTGQKLQFESRARQDIDFIFLAADAQHGRQIKPQLSFYHAARVPVYSTSHIYTGSANAVQDLDLDGVVFGDMPWMLVNNGKMEELRQKLQRDWAYAHTDLDRLYALGVDSYAVLPQLNRLSTDNTARFNGVTSMLSLDSHGRLQRQLTWARFSRGLPRLIDTSLKRKGQFEIENDAAVPAKPAPRS
ncbi:MAG: penicillin-binding protein activator [Gammaproteobacteria bacterium]|nr:penicillin-binding protein activator [Gammaproteobacteria bacterium]